jgi:hypothetical protein
MTMAKTHGTRQNGTAITEKDVAALADEAEHGYDVDDILRRRQGGRRAMGSGPAEVESVRLDPELKRDLLLRAAKDGVSVTSRRYRPIAERRLHVALEDQLEVLCRAQSGDRWRENLYQPPAVTRVLMDGVFVRLLRAVRDTEQR